MKKKILVIVLSIAFLETFSQNLSKTNLMNSETSNNWIIEAQKEVEEFEIIKKNAKKNDAYALYRLFELSYDTKALDKAIELNYIPALIKTGNIKNLRKAYYTLGSKEAGLKLAKLLYNENNKKTNDNIEAYKIFSKYYLEDAEAAYLLGVQYYEGLGVQKDKTKGLDILEFAMQKGSKNAEKKLFSIAFLNDHIAENVDFIYKKTDYNNNKTFAVIIVNENYQNGLKVHYAINDGRIFRLYLIKTLGIPENNIRIFENATLNDIKKSLLWLKQVQIAFENDIRIIIYYNGQGFSNKHTSQISIMPIDYIEGNTTEQNLTITDIKREIGNGAHLGTLLICDANFNGKDRFDGNIEQTRGVGIKIKEDSSLGLSNFVTFLSTQENGTSFAYKEFRHSLFTYELLKVLRDCGGDISVGDMFDRISKHVQDNSLKKFGKKQEPKSISNDTKWKLWQLK